MATGILFSDGREQTWVLRVRIVSLPKIRATLTPLLAMADLASPACNLETRKTAPGLRLVDCGQVGDVDPCFFYKPTHTHTHIKPLAALPQDWWRSESQNNGLFDMVMIKDNHITIAGGITNAVKSVDLNLQMEVEVETRTIEEIEKVLEYASQTKTSLTQMMLDNMVVLPNGDVDASGNVTLETVHKIGQTRVDFISR
ncbi:hypothetical protein DVH24_040357 [Malus domestica]|uniref:Quinolinate phosphoribosyl transferase C-terminal domain-containing protein n=1 Tax=Malus domestica TaxID=3750 RepID=A0A498I7J3_MALDO|nr:hypothetical protein DVH24_040357 [Malus domestica]